MDEERLKAYFDLSRKLLTRSSSEKVKIIQNNRELVDEGLLQAMVVLAELLAAEGKQKTAKILGSVRSELLEIISEYPSLFKASSQNYLEFLEEVLLAIQKSSYYDRKKVVYPLLEANLDKLDDNFIDILQAWASFQFSLLDIETARYTAQYIESFSNIIRYFPLGNKANNIEIAIAGYKQVLTVYTYFQEDFPDDWPRRTQEVAGDIPVQLLARDQLDTGHDYVPGRFVGMSR